MTSPQQTPLAAALRYAERGWHVFPVHTPQADGSCSCRKLDCKDIGRHPRTRHGFKDATVDPETIRHWWKQWPDANIGIATGARSSIVVLDEDPRHGGDVARAALEEQHGPLPPTLEARSGRGRHRYFRHPGVEIRGSVGTIGAGLDVRADGNYIIAPPSRHENGQQYTWINEREPAPCPDWLLDRMRGSILTAKRQPTRQANSAPLPEPDANRVPEGQRNTWLTSIAGSLRARVLNQEALDAALQAINEAQCDPPLPEPEVSRIATSIARYEPGPSDPELERLSRKLAEARNHISLVMRALMNPHLKSRALYAVRLAIVVENIWGNGPTGDGFVRVSDSIVADPYRNGKEFLTRTTRYRARKQLANWGLFTFDPRRTTESIPQVDPSTGEIIGASTEPRLETWIQRDLPLIEKLRVLANYCSPSSERIANRHEVDSLAAIAEDTAERLLAAINPIPSVGSISLLPMCQDDTDIYVTKLVG